MHNPTATTDIGTNGQGSGTPAIAKVENAASSSAISREFYNFLADIEDLIKETTSLTGDELAHARVKLNARVAAAKASAEEVGDSITLRARQTASMTNDYVHEQPWKVLGASAAIAFLLGVLIARRS
ncbi:DUF883 family protein [Pseudomonas solani]|uniref:DUF883 family protein n=1 Tax=Pseudomonas solani TaxID=2731552 RepID=A0AAU7Y9D9_9PSED